MNWFKNLLYNNPISKFFKTRKRKALLKKKKADIRKKDPFIYK